MPLKLDYDRPYTPEELASCLEIDVRFVRIAESAGLALDHTGRLTVRVFWEWFGDHFEAFRTAAGMRPRTIPKSLKGYDRQKARFDAALITIVEFCGCLPFECSMRAAAKVLRPRRRK